MVNPVYPRFTEKDRAAVGGALTVIRRMRAETSRKFDTAIIDGDPVEELEYLAHTETMLSGLTTDLMRIIQYLPVISEEEAVESVKAEVRRQERDRTD